MQNFTYQNDTRIHFGKDQIRKIGAEIPKGAKVLLLYGGGSIKRNGIYDQVVKALVEHQWTEFAGIEPNPNYATLMRAVAQVKADNIDYLLAVGGGSVVDGSKFVAAAAKYQGEDPWDILAKGKAVESAMPVACVLTLPATGTESNGNAVITKDKDKLDFTSSLVRPQFAILDPQVTMSLSERQLSNGVVDAFVHVVEQYLTYSVNAKVQDRFAEGLLLTLIEEGPKLLDPASRSDLTARANVMWSATWALNGMIGAGVPQDWATHMIGHELTGAHGIDHARTLSIILPAVLRVRKAQKRDKLLQYAERVWGLGQGDDDSRIDQAIANTEDFFRTMRVPVRLAEVDLDASHIDHLVDKLAEHGLLKLGERGDITPQTAKRILQAAL